ncbi:MAG: hypothetical protein ACK5NG_07185 [Chthoniobacterales bacterium]
MKLIRCIFLTALLPCLLSAAEDDWFAFPVAFDFEKAPAFDLSWMNEKPAGSSGWLSVNGERILDGRGREFRIFGANLTGGANFPDEATAKKLARHFSVTGYNMARLHFLDHQWAGKGRSRSLLPPSNEVARDGLQEEYLERLDMLVAALRKEGVRLNFNLHVGRQYPGAPEGLPLMGKGTGLFMPAARQEFKAYVRALMTHVNPHTGLRYADDPAVAILELSNEDTLITDPWWLNSLPEPYAGELTRQWNDWIAKRYPDRDALIAAWGENTGRIGPDILVDKPVDQWELQKSGDAEHRMEKQSDGAVKWTAEKKGSEIWHIQASSGPVDFQAGQRYEATFRASSPEGHPLSLTVMQSHSPWKMLDGGEVIDIDSEEREYRIALQTDIPIDAEENPPRLVFSMENQTGMVTIRDLQCYKVSEGWVEKDWTPGSGNIPLANPAVPLVVKKDFFRFLADVEIGFATEMKHFLREELGCKALISYSQVLFGGLPGARREALVSDFVDNHAYWNHPIWSESLWDSKNWQVKNYSQIEEIDTGALGGLAVMRVAGKPYTVSEYDVPAPSDYQAELWPLFTAAACVQGWSGIYHYTFAHSTEEFSHSKIHGYFNSSGNPAKTGFRPAAALIFRLGLLPSAIGHLTLPASDEQIFDITALSNGNTWNVDQEFWGELYAGLFEHRLGLALNGEGSQSAGPPTGVKWHREAGVVTVASPAARIWTGKLGGKTWSAGDIDLSVKLLDDPAPTASVMLVSLDGKPITQSKKLLLTAMRRAENQGMGWNENRDSVADQWGEAPVKVLGFYADLTFPESIRWAVSTLDSAGQLTGKKTAPASTLKITPKDKTIWWILERE